MPLPELNGIGDLPPGVHRATLAEVTARFGASTLQRRNVTNRLRRLYSLSHSTGKVDRFVIFGSYITDKPEPNDVDVVLIMRDDFRWQEYDETVKAIFEHNRADEEFGASIFWIRPSLLILESIDEFVAHWQIKRDQTQRGIVEIVTPETTEVQK